MCLLVVRVVDMVVDCFGLLGERELGSGEEVRVVWGEG